MIRQLILILALILSTANVFASNGDWQGQFKIKIDKQYFSVVHTDKQVIFANVFYARYCLKIAKGFQFNDSIFPTSVTLCQNMTRAQFIDQLKKLNPAIYEATKVS